MSASSTRATAQEDGSLVEMSNASSSSSSSSTTNNEFVVRNEQRYGIPMGAVILPNQHIYPFRNAIQTALSLKPNERLQFRGIEKLDDHTKQIHVSVQVATAILDGNVELMEFLKSCNGTFISGVRMKHPPKKQQQQQYVVTSNNNTNKNYYDTTAKEEKFTFVELFAGIGGFRLGLEPLGGKCVLANECDPYACQIYRRQFGNDNDDDDVLIEGDVLDIVPEDFPVDGIDILTAGFPCQPFSIRGDQMGLQQNNNQHKKRDQQSYYRGQYYQELVRILMQVRPKYFIFENVVGLVTMEGGLASHSNNQHVFKPGNVMNHILEEFQNCGYKVEWKVINSKYFIPQYRERVYFIGSLLELNLPDMNWENVVTISSSPPALLLKDYLEQDYQSSAQVQDCELSMKQWSKVQDIHKGDAMEEARLKVFEDHYAPTLISSYRTPGAKTTKFVMEERDGTPRHGNPLRPRLLTPQECSNIMGFPRDFNVSYDYISNRPASNGGSSISIGHVYKGLGNAVVPPVIKAIGKEMLRLMEESAS